MYLGDLMGKSRIWSILVLSFLLQDSPDNSQRKPWKKQVFKGDLNQNISLINENALERG